MSSYEIARATDRLATEARTANLIAWVANGKCYVRDVPVLSKEIRKRLGLDVVETTPDRASGYLPGDMVRISMTGTFADEYNGRHGVVIYGPDDEKGWLVASAPGSIRCVAEELTMITPREGRGN